MTDSNQLPSWLADSYLTARNEKGNALACWAILMPLSEALTEYLLVQVLSLYITRVRAETPVPEELEQDLGRRLATKMSFGSKVSVLRDLAKKIPEPVGRHFALDTDLRFPADHPVTVAWRAITGKNGQSVDLWSAFDALVVARNRSTGHGGGEPPKGKGPDWAPKVLAALESLMANDLPSIRSVPLARIVDVRVLKRRILHAVTYEPLLGTGRLARSTVEVEGELPDSFDPNALVFWRQDGKPDEVIRVPDWLAVINPDEGEERHGTIGFFEGMVGDTIQFQYRRSGNSTHRADLQQKLFAEAPFIANARGRGGPALNAASVEKYTEKVHEFLANDSRLDERERFALDSLANALELDDATIREIENRVASEMGLSLTVQTAETTGPRSEPTGDSPPKPPSTVVSLDVSHLGDFLVSRAMTVIAGTGAAYRPESKTFEFENQQAHDAAFDKLVAAGIMLSAPVLERLTNESVAQLGKVGRWLKKAELLSLVPMSPTEWDVLRREAKLTGKIKPAGSGLATRYGLPHWAVDVEAPGPTAVAEATTTEPSAPSLGVAPVAEVEDDDATDAEADIDCGVGDFTVSQFQRFDLETYLRDLLGHSTTRRINSQLSKHHGRTLVRKVFPEWDPEVERSFLASMTRAHAQTVNASYVLAYLLDAEVEAIDERLVDHHGNTQLRNVFPELRWA